jgi:hypothetical protein
MSEAGGTTVSNTAEGDARTLYPLTVALALSRMAADNTASAAAAAAAAAPVPATAPAAMPEPA